MSTRDSTQGDPSTTVMDDSPGSPPSAGVATSPTRNNALFAFHPNILRCFICGQPPVDPISASCGHVFCWPCMHQWLQNGPKPCLVCGLTLRRDRDIIPLYGGGTTSTDTGTDMGSRSHTTSDAPRDRIDITPPRPRNPLLPTTAPLSPGDNSGNENLLSTGSEVRLSPRSMLTAYENTIHQLSGSLDVERDRVMNLDIDRLDLELEVADLELQHAELSRELREREWIWGKERDEAVRSGRRLEAWEARNRRLAWEAEEARQRERRRVERGSQMAELMAGLQQRLELDGASTSTATDAGGGASERASST